MNNLVSSNNEYFDAKEEDEEREEYFPAQSMFIENEWIRNSPGGEERSKAANKTTTMSKSQNKTENNFTNYEDSPYFENARIESEKVRFISPIQNTKNHIESTSSSPKINRSIINELLPTQIQIDSTTGPSSSYNRMTQEEFEKYLRNDKIYGQVFKGSLIAWSLFSLYAILSNDRSNPIQGSYSEIGGWFTCLLILGLGLSAVWARVLADQTEIVVYGLMLAVPAGFGLLGLFSFSHWYILTGLIFIAVSVVSSAVVYFNKETLKTTVEIVHNAAIFIQATPKVYPLTLKIVAIYAAFVLVWLKAFMGLFNNSNWSWIFSTATKVSFVIILIWTGSVLSTVQKFILATWIRTWMNQTDDSNNENEGQERKKLNEESFGSICLAAGLLTIGKMIKITAKSVHFTSKTLGKFIPCSGLISEILNWAFSLIFVAEKFMHRFTDFAVYNLALSHESDGFLDSCKQLGRFLDGHLQLAVTTDTTAQLLLSFSTILISFASTALILLIAKNHVTWSSGLLIGLLAASVTDFISNIYTTAIDSMFLCYVMDLQKPERAGKIDPKIQEAFATKLLSAV